VGSEDPRSSSAPPRAAPLLGKLSLKSIDEPGRFLDVLDRRVHIAGRKVR
jgi:hypothetical protein